MKNRLCLQSPKERTAKPTIPKSPKHSPQKSERDKAHRRKQGAAVVTYGKPLSRSNAV